MRKLSFHSQLQNPAMYYEQYILGEITLDEFKVKQQKFKQVTKDQKAIELEIEECQQVYSQFSRCAKSGIRNFPFQQSLVKLIKL